jgi:plasmid stability protein
MATLYIRGVPNDLYDELKALAATDAQSLNAEALAIFADGLALRRMQAQRREALAGLDALRARIGNTPGDSLHLLREDRTR